MKSNQNGFLLVEILIALSLILFIATIAIPSLNFLNQQIIISDLEKLNMAFSYMQQSAVASNKNLVLKFDNNNYQYENYKETISNKVKFASNPEIMGPPSDPINFTLKGTTFLKNQVTFYSTGKIQPGSAYLTDDSKSYLYALTVSVSQVSFIRKYKYVNGRWMLLN